MRVTITTDGGFTGRGIGNASADVDDEFLGELDVDSWEESYTAPGADLVRFTLEFGDRRVMWMEGATLPEDLRALHSRVVQASSLP